MQNPFKTSPERPQTTPGLYSEDERGLANRNSGMLLELLKADVTPVGAHYLLTHFDVPLIDESAYRLTLKDGFEAPISLSLADIKSHPSITRQVTMECAGNGRAQVSPRPFSMPWAGEAVGNAAWTGTPLWPLIAEAKPRSDTVEISFTGADFGFDKGDAHYFGRALTMAQLQDLDVMLVWAMNDQPLAPQHGAPLRLIVPGWYGMASVKWLTTIAALNKPYDGFQQVQTYRYRDTADDPGRPVTAMKPRALMVPPGVPDWTSRKRYVVQGPVTVQGRAWSGAGVPITKVEFGVNGDWQATDLRRGAQYGWSHWSTSWHAPPGWHHLQCRAWDETGQCQPMTPVFDMGGFGNNAVQTVDIFVDEDGLPA